MDIIDKIIWAESGGDPNQHNFRSSASGLGQFIDSTWLSLVKQHRPDIAKGKSDADLIALKSDPDLSRQMTGAYLDNNAGILKRNGLPVTDGTKYLAHFAGPGGAVRILEADPSTPAAALLGPQFAKANPKQANYTAGQLAAWADQRMAAAPTSLAGPRVAPRQNVDVPPADDARKPQPRFPQGGAPLRYLDQTVAAERLRDAAGGSAPLLPPNTAPPVAPASFDDRFGNWPSSPQASAPARPTAALPDAQPASDGGNTGFGIYKYPTENQLGFDPGALSASPNAAAPPDARYLVRLPSPQTSAPGASLPTGTVAATQPTAAGRPVARVSCSSNGLWSARPI